MLDLPGQLLRNQIYGQHKQITAFMLESESHGGQRGHVSGTHSEHFKISMMELS